MWRKDWEREREKPYLAALCVDTCVGLLFFPLQVYAQSFGSITGFKFMSDMFLLSLANKVGLCKTLAGNSEIEFISQRQ